MSRRNPAQQRGADRPPDVLPLLLVAASAVLDLLQSARIWADCTAGAIILTLPPAASVPPGSAYEAAKVAGVAANTLSLAPDGADTINGVNAAFNMTGAGMAGAQFVSDGVSAWRITLSDAGATAAAVTKIASGDLIILAGTSSITSAPLGLGSLVGKPIVVSIRQTAFDGTAQRVQGFEDAVDNTAVTIVSNANATANVVVSFFVDAR